MAPGLQFRPLAQGPNAPNAPNALNAPNAPNLGDALEVLLTNLPDDIITMFSTHMLHGALGALVCTCTHMKEALGGARGSLFQQFCQVAKNKQLRRLREISSRNSRNWVNDENEFDVKWTWISHWTARPFNVGHHPECDAYAEDGSVHVSTLHGNNPPVYHIDFDERGRPRFYVWQAEACVPGTTTRRARCTLYYLARCDVDPYMREPGPTLVRTLTLLDLTDCGLDALDASAIARALHTCKNISTLSLCKNYVGAKGMLTICDMLPEALSTLNLSYNCIGYKCIDMDMSYLCDALRKSERLSSLNLSCNCIGYRGAWAIAAVLRENTTLTSLSLESNWIQSEGACAIASALRENTTLTSLDLANNQLSISGLRKGGHGPYTASGIGEMTRALRANSTLNSLNLARNRLGVDAMRHLSMWLCKGHGDECVPEININISNCGHLGSCAPGLEALGEALGEALDNISGGRRVIVTAGGAEESGAFQAAREAGRERAAHNERLRRMKATARTAHAQARRRGAGVWFGL
jgi:hypothetical protein